MTPHQRIIERIGGVPATAAKLSELRDQRVAKTTVQHWHDSGFIPSKHQEDILSIGRDCSPPITPDDFFGTEAA